MLETRLTIASSILFIAPLVSAKETEVQETGAGQEGQEATQSPPEDEGAQDTRGPGDGSEQGPPDMIDQKLRRASQVVAKMRRGLDGSSERSTAPACSLTWRTSSQVSPPSVER